MYDHRVDEQATASHMYFGGVVIVNLAPKAQRTFTDSCTMKKSYW